MALTLLSNQRMDTLLHVIISFSHPHTRTNNPIAFCGLFCRHFAAGWTMVGSNRAEEHGERNLSHYNPSGRRGERWGPWWLRWKQRYLCFCTGVSAVPVCSAHNDLNRLAICHMDTHLHDCFFMLTSHTIHLDLMCSAYLYFHHVCSHFSL